MDHPPPPSFEPKDSRSSFSFTQGGVLPSDTIPWHVWELVSVEMCHRWRAEIMTSTLRTRGLIYVVDFLLTENCKSC